MVWVSDLGGDLARGVWFDGTCRSYQSYLLVDDTRWVVVGPHRQAHMLLQRVKVAFWLRCSLGN